MSADGREVQNPSQGRIVSYVLTDGHAPAIIAAVYSEDLVDLHVFPSKGRGAFSLEQVSRDDGQAGKPYLVGTWHWPPRK